MHEKQMKLTLHAMLLVQHTGGGRVGVAPGGELVWRVGGFTATAVAGAGPTHREPRWSRGGGARVERRREEEPGRGDWGETGIDRKSTRLNSSHITRSRMPSSA